MKWRISAVVFSSGLFLSGIGAAFLHEDRLYETPEPPPAEWQPPALGSVVKHPAISRHANAILLHFHSDQCPCSRFAQDHVRSLARRFAGKVDVVVVTQDGADAFSWASRTISDRDESLARATGVFATPQAVLIDTAGKILFRGSYNKSRFCTDPSSEYVRIALEDYLQGRPQKAQPAAQKAFGCAMGKRSIS